MKLTHALLIAVAVAGFGVAAGAADYKTEKPGRETLGKAGTNATIRGDADNTGRNVRDRDDQTLTPVDQGNTEADLNMTKLIRKAVMDVKDLSVTARNCKIITNNGQVTLRGPVKTAAEKTTIGDIARQMAKEGKVDNQLEVMGDKTDATKTDTPKSM